MNSKCRFGHPQNWSPPARTPPVEAAKGESYVDFKIDAEEDWGNDEVEIQLKESVEGEVKNEQPDMSLRVTTSKETGENNGVQNHVGDTREYGQNNRGQNNNRGKKNKYKVKREQQRTEGKYKDSHKQNIANNNGEIRQEARGNESPENKMEPVGQQQRSDVILSPLALDQQLEIIDRAVNRLTHIATLKAKVKDLKRNKEVNLSSVNVLQAKIAQLEEQAGADLRSLQ